MRKHIFRRIGKYLHTTEYCRLAITCKRANSKEYVYEGDKHESSLTGSESTELELDSIKKGNRYKGKAA